jgi:hypothetical protein
MEEAGAIAKIHHRYPSLLAKAVLKQFYPTKGMTLADDFLE